MWTAIGNLGDAALTLPLAAVCFAWLTRSLYGWRIALSWATLLAAAMLLVGVTKILHAGCGVQIRAVHFRAISGHALLAAAVWPMACLLMLHDGWNTRTLRALLPGLALAATIAVARARDDTYRVRSDGRLDARCARHRRATETMDGCTDPAARIAAARGGVGMRRGGACVWTACGDSGCDRRVCAGGLCKGM
jgi:hypothetical protein